MKIAFLHVLPLEYYPPATNTLDILACQAGLQVRAFSSHNLKGLTPYENPAVDVRRQPCPMANQSALRRLFTHLRWPLAVTACLAAWKPDVILYIEPHSALATWLSLRLCGRHARLFIHHHEYYAPTEFSRPGMRVVRVGSRLERRSLFPRAVWISQTNPTRLSLLREDNPGIPAEKFRVLPNYPPRAWVKRARHAGRPDRKDGPLRLIYLGSASFADTYIRELVEWVTARTAEVQLHVCGFNVTAEVWEWLDQIRPGNVTQERAGWTYPEVPERLGAYDVGVILYKGNTLNFIHNAPNKLFEYLACGLGVWYPPVMKEITRLHGELGRERLCAVDFSERASMDAALNRRHRPEIPPDFPCVAESALAPLLKEMLVAK